MALVINSQQLPDTIIKSANLLTYWIGTPGFCDSYSRTITEISNNQFKATGPEGFNNTNYNYKVTFAKL